MSLAKFTNSLLGCHGGESMLPTTIIFWSEHWESDPR